MIDKLLQILKEISEIITQNNDLFAVQSQIAPILAKGLNADVCSIYTYDEKINRLVLTATYGLNPQAVNNVSMAPGEGLSGQSFKKSEVLNISNPQNHPDFKLFENTGEIIYSSFLSLPLITGGNALGILVIQKKQSAVFPEAVVDMARSVATQLANIILNSKMLTTLSEQKSEIPVSIQSTGFEQIILRGISANGGIAAGSAYIFKSRNHFKEISHGNVDDPKAAITLLNSAIELTKQKTMQLENMALTMISEADASIFGAHLLFLNDKTLINGIKKEITENRHSIEFSTRLVFEKYEKIFLNMDNPVFRDKIMDIKDVLLQILESVKEINTGKRHDNYTENPEANHILIAEEILPSDLLRMPIDKISAIVCEKGGVTAHVAILAKALNIPALLGVSNLLENVSYMDPLIVDCHAEILYVNPDNHIKDRFAKNSKYNDDADAELIAAPAVTTDGVKINLKGNVSLICETPLLKQYNLSGIGLYRTEFMYMIRDHLPSEDEQLKVFLKIIQEVKDNDVTIRVLDIGADKPLPYMEIPSEENPALGLRGVRLLLQKPDILKTHLRAILRAAVNGNLKLLFPMVTTITEITKVKEIIEEVKVELTKEELPFNNTFKFGIMLEVPSVLFELEKLIPHVDYMSIGSNDLLQYTFAVDRVNDSVSHPDLVLHPVFLKIIKNIGDAFLKYKDKEVAICGEMASNIFAVPTLIGAGIYDLSMAPKQSVEIKRIINSVSIDQCQNLLAQSIILDTAQEVKELIKLTFPTLYK
ncbi:MAG: phosphoenolpyruvate--protein phosphotransferase [Deltaproteobacteria bacterium]|nr:phosphoenolpyruvate--protein phosphotransferase [Deltaproteobacteria bacterium]